MNLVSVSLVPYLKKISKYFFVNMKIQKNDIRILPPPLLLVQKKNIFIAPTSVI